IIVPELDDEPLTIIEGIHEGIIDERLFYEVQDIIEGRYKKRNRPLYNNTREELPLRGVLHCFK
ncbi:MAG: recombinase family protein, partial [Flavobacteriales bacterium]|nr:recombinase family protein [Flavobacteriales bacterium]